MDPFFLCEELEPRFSWSYSAFQHVIIRTAKKNTRCYWKVEMFDLFKDSCNTHLQILLKYLVAKIPKGWITRMLIRNLIDKERKFKYLGVHSCLKRTLMSPWVLDMNGIFERPKMGGGVEGSVSRRSCSHRSFFSGKITDRPWQLPASCAGCAPMRLH